MTFAWDGVSDFYEDDEPIDKIRAAMTEESDAVTGQEEECRVWIVG